jgi:small subunit ribosomal protein S23
MGGKQIRPGKVYKTVVTELQNAILPKREMNTPPWMAVIHQVPPSETLVRTPHVFQSTTPQPLKGTPPKPKKIRNLYRPRQIVHPEDSLRNTFFRDHPWELARPRILVETDGKDYQRCDWSKGLVQPGFQLNGES